MARYSSGKQPSEDEYTGNNQMDVVSNNTRFGCTQLVLTGPKFNHIITPATTS